MEINKNTLSNFREDFKVAASILEEQYGIAIELGTITFPRTNPNSFGCKLTAINVGDMVVGESVEQAKFNANARKYGFEPSDYNRTTMIYGKAHKLIGFNPTARKNVCIIRQISNGSDYVMNISTTKLGLL